jgi:hypothetical protein
MNVLVALSDPSTTVTAGLAASTLPSIWEDPILAIGVATTAVSLLVVTTWLLRRRSRNGRGAAAVCLIVSIALHLVLIFFLPHLRKLGGGSASRDNADDSVGDSEMVFATFDPAAPLEATAAASDTADDSNLQPLPISRMASLRIESQPPTAPLADPTPPPLVMPQSLAQESPSSVEDLLDDWYSDDANIAAASSAAAVVATTTAAVDPVNSSPATATITDSMPATVPGLKLNDFANRFGQSKRIALLQTGGDESTEAAVEAALRFLAADQRPDGSWDPATSGAGRETLTLGTDRKQAGRRATTGLTGLALLSMLGAGNTHQQGPLADNVRRGLTYLILNQKPDGSMAGDAEIYEATYCHGMAALAMCEAAAMTGDPSATASAAAAVRYTMALQHPSTGGWRYVRGDPGDLSQLGWQAMVLQSGRAAGVPTSDHSFALTSRFLQSVRGGKHGGLASYRPGDGPTRTMTAEALATRLLIGEKVPEAEVREAEEYLLRQPPGIGRDNYYCWYYASIALHQLQDDAWRQWNEAMKRHLVSRQTASGSWPTDSEWGGYGGRVYTTAMAALCLEVYYRHSRSDVRTVGQ